MSNGTKMLITDAGLAEVVNAEASGTAPVVLSHIAFGTGQYTATANMTALKSEFKRFDSVKGGAIGDNVIHLSLHDNSTDTYSVYEVGVFTENGTLFGVYSQTTPIVQKATDAEVMLVIDIALSDINVESVTVGDTNFILNPATTTTKGIVELATEAEAKAGTDTTRAITPKTLDATIEAHDNIVHRSGNETIAGTKTFTGALVRNVAMSGNTPHTIKTVDTNGKGSISTISYYTDDTLYHRMQTDNPTASKNAYFDVQVKDSGTARLYFNGSATEKNVDFQLATKVRVPTPGSSPENTEAANVGWCNGKFLPLAGGTMSGSINLGYQQLKGIHSLELNPPIDTANNGGFVDFHFNRSSDDYTARIIEDENGVLSVLAANGFKHNGKNIVRSINNTTADASGNVSITSVASATSATKATQDGNGKVIADTYAVDSNTVHKTGNETIAGNKEFTGTLTNDSKYVLNNSFLMPSDSGAVNITAGTSSAGGAYFRLYGKDHSSGAGQFVLATTDGETTNALTGKPDGTLTWNGEELATESRITSIMDSIYPVGSLYFCTQSTCPLASIISGSTWEKVGSSIITSVNTSVPIKGTGKTLGLSNGSETAGLIVDYSADGYYTSLDVRPEVYDSNIASSGAGDSGKGTWRTSIVGVTTDSSKSGIVGTVTRSSLTVNIFKRTA